MINTASSNATIGIPLGFTAHGAAKAGVLGLTSQLATKGAPHRVRVNAISPGFVDPRHARHAPAHQGLRLAVIHLVPASIEAVDIACCALCLASDESRFVTGAEIPVDAGQAAGRPAADRPVVERR